MKTKIFKQHLTLLFILLFSPIVIYNFYNPQTETHLSPPAPGGDQFLISAMSCGDEMDYANMRDLNINLWHRYASYQSGWVGITNDLLYEDPDNYADAVKSRIEQNHQNGMLTYYHRPKIDYLAFSRRSNYQCEIVTPNPDQSNLWFWAYNTHDVGNDIPDGNATVRYCSSINMSGYNQGWVCIGLKANREQCKGFWGSDPDTTYDWYVKPSIRILPSVVQNTPNKKICRIDILDWYGNTIGSKDILAKHFAPNNNPNLYNGDYIEEYYYEQIDNELPSSIKIDGDLLKHANPYDWDSETCLIDFRVWWYDEAEMWIDYVRVDDWRADRLFEGYFETDVEWIKKEVEIAAHYPGYVRNFYIEEFEYPIIPCVKYVNEKIKYWSEQNGISNPPLSLVINMNEDVIRQGIPNWNNFQSLSTAFVKRNIFDSTGGYNDYVITDYPLIGNPSRSYPFYYSKIPNTLPACGTSGCIHDEYAGILAVSEPPEVYDEWLQETLDENPDPSYQFTQELKSGQIVSRETNTRFMPMLQTHIWHGTPPPTYMIREPINEEIKMMANVAITYGAKGILWFWYSNWGGNFTPNSQYGRGLLDAVPPPDEFGNFAPNTDFYKRHDNVYGQYSGTPGIDTSSKFNTVATLNTLFKDKWGPTLMSFDDDYTKSYIYRLENFSCLQNEYFGNITSSYRGSQQVMCMDSPPMPIPNDGLVSECREDTYLQVATFEKEQDDGNNYFMIVNRRCSPLQSVTHNDGERFIKVHFDSDHEQLNGANNWKIIDLNTGWDTTINKTYSAHVLLLGWYKPGEGRLYKMVPVPKSGGTLAGDEVISGTEFTCEAPVYNNGHNITIGANTTIHFTDSAKFVMNGGVFTVGDQNTSAPQNITSDAVPGGSWRGHSFTNCEVKIYGATFTGLANDTTYAVNIIDCPVVDIRNCTFNTNSSLKGGINAICFNNPFIAINNIYIGGNTFNSSGSTIPTINVSSYAGVTTPLIIENNSFSEGNTAVFLSGVIGGAIKGNTITDNYIGINALTSSIDVVQNNISSTVNGSMGLFAAGGSELKLNSSGAFTLGGLNNISNEGTGSNNINVDGSYFLLDDGENIFNISSDQSSYHLYGYFPMFTAVTTEETNNCFKVNSSPVDPPINMVTSGYQGSQITFNFNPYLAGCEIIGGGDGLAINLGNGIYDTIYTGGSGSGGSKSSVESVRRTDKQAATMIPPRRDFETASQFLGRGALVLSTPKQIYDSVCVLMRYRNYTQAKTKCLDLINTYPDSIQSLNAVSKLFLATVASDTTYNSANNLKIFYENLILNHPGNTSLVKRANYYILKCKVRMREYSQALSGFQQIINQNPYSYEGLIARWDYMATSLLIQGQGGGEPSITNYGLGITNNNQSDEFDKFEELGDDRSPFTKEQRQDIRKSINTAIEISKNDDETKIKKLEEKSELGDVNASKELSQMKSLKQVVKTEKPKNIIEHVRIVSEDIRKVFGSNTSSKGNEPKNIPMVFRLSQNYPNPFNPVTKINYDLPKDSKVKIVIYDILGREVKRLVNNELKTAGSYIVDFNASNYASGVYFYRIEAEEPNGSKFVDSKKMVLLK